MQVARLHSDLARLLALILLKGDPGFSSDLPSVSDHVVADLLGELHAIQTSRDLSAQESLLIDDAKTRILDYLAERRRVRAHRPSRGRPSGKIDALSERILAADALLAAVGFKKRSDFLSAALFKLGLKKDNRSPVEAHEALIRRNRSRQNRCFDFWLCALAPQLFCALFWIYREASPPVGMRYLVDQCMELVVKAFSASEPLEQSTRLLVLEECFEAITVACGPAEPPRPLVVNNWRDALAGAILVEVRNAGTDVVDNPASAACG